MIQLTRDARAIERLLRQNAREPFAHDDANWVTNGANFALVEGDDLAL